MKKLGKVSIVALSLFVTFIAGALIVRAQHPVPHGDVFACFSQGNGYLVDDHENCQSGEDVIGWYSAAHFVGLGDILEELQLADEAFVEELEAVDERLEDEDEARTEADEALQEQIDELEERVATLEQLLQHVSRSGDDLVITGANLHVVNGTGTTDGIPNTLGNVIIGYNEFKGNDDRSGSHMLVIGSHNNFSSFGGIVAGEWNETSGEWATVTGGNRNIASGDYSSVSGGGSNTASGDYSSVSGGGNNIASFYASSVSGGNTNVAEGASSSVSGGDHNTASGGYASVSGGRENVASGAWAAVCGGDNNFAESWYSSIGGGQNHVTTSFYEFKP